MGQTNTGLRIHDLRRIHEYILANTALWDEEENNPLRPDCGHGKMAGKPWVT